MVGLFGYCNDHCIDYCVDLEKKITEAEKDLKQAEEDYEEQKQNTSSSAISFFKKSNALYSLTTASSSQTVEWQCYNKDGLLCQASGDGYPKTYSADGRNPAIKTYNGGGVFPVLGSRLDLNPVSVFSNQRFSEFLQFFFLISDILFL